MILFYSSYVDMLKGFVRVIPVWISNTNKAHSVQIYSLVIGWTWNWWASQFFYHICIFQDNLAVLFHEHTYQQKLKKLPKSQQRQPL